MRVASALKWAFADLDTLTVEADRQTMPPEDRTRFHEAGSVVGAFLGCFLLCGAFFTATIASFGARFVLKLAYTDQVSPDLEWPMAFIYLAIPCGSGLMCFRFLQVAWAFYRTGELPHHDAAKIEGVVIPDVPVEVPAATATAAR